MCEVSFYLPLSKGRGAWGEGSIRTLHVFEYEMEIEIAYFKIDPSFKIVPFRIQLKDNFSLSLGESPIKSRVQFVAPYKANRVSHLQGKRGRGEGFAGFVIGRKDYLNPKCKEM